MCNNHVAHVVAWFKLIYVGNPTHVNLTQVLVQCGWTGKWIQYQSLAFSIKMCRTGLEQLVLVAQIFNKIQDKSKVVHLFKIQVLILRTNSCIPVTSILFHEKAKRFILFRLNRWFLHEVNLLGLRKLKKLASSCINIDCIN